MLQGAAYCSRPVYGHSHYKKFWLKKMETEDEQARFLPPEPDPLESFGRGIFCKGKSSLDVSFSSKETNFSPLEIKGNGRSSNGVSSLRSGRQEFSTFEDEAREGIFDCALSIGMQTPGEEQREGEQKYETQSFVRNLQNEDDGKKSSGLHKLRIHSLKRLLHSDGDSQIGAQKMTEIEFCEGTVSRTCSDCKTNRTPLWRNGPNGPKSLCNACGIRYKKIGKRSVGNGNGDRQKLPPKFPSSVYRLTKFNKRKQHNTTADPYDPFPPRKRNAAAASSSLSAETVTRHDPFLNGGVAEENQNCGRHVRMRSFAKDEEEGAVLLMGLSCGLVNA